MVGSAYMVALSGMLCIGVDNFSSGEKENNTFQFLLRIEHQVSYSLFDNELMRLWQICAPFSSHASDTYALRWR